MTKGNIFNRWGQDLNSSAGALPPVHSDPRINISNAIPFRQYNICRVCNRHRHSLGAGVGGNEGAGVGGPTASQQEKEH